MLVGMQLKLVGDLSELKTCLKNIVYYRRLN